MEHFLEDFDSEEFDDASAYLPDLIDLNLSWQEIVEICTPGWLEQIKALKEQGYLGGK